LVRNGLRLLLLKIGTKDTIKLSIWLRKPLPAASATELLNLAIPAYNQLLCNKAPSPTFGTPSFSTWLINTALVLIILLIDFKSVSVLGLS
jgi:hypothetical protein